MAEEYRWGTSSSNCSLFKIILRLTLLSRLQHANEDVEKMILGNKCDMESKRAVSKEKGEAVSDFSAFVLILVFRKTSEMCLRFNRCFLDVSVSLILLTDRSRTWRSFHRNFRKMQCKYHRSLYGINIIDFE